MSTDKLGWLLRSLCAVLALVLSKTSCAEDGWDGHVLTIFWENDAVAQADRHYTQGAGFHYLAKDRQLPSWLDKFSAALPAFGLEVQAEKAGFGFVQEIYTPEDLDATEVVADDRPYAGWLYTRLRLQRRGYGYSDWPSLETFALDLGVIGPPSLAEITQKKWHGRDPKGWDNQLEFEPGFVLRYQRLCQLTYSPPHSSWSARLMPRLHGSLGNVSTSLGFGATVHLGYNVPDMVSACPTRTDLDYGFYLLAEVDGRLVARDIFLDGNTFRSSHSVEKFPAVGSFRVGVTFVLKRIEITVSETWRTPEFERQQGIDTFGAATVTYKF